MANEALKKRYNELRNILATDLTNWDPRTKPSMEGRQNSARTEIQDVQNKLAGSILTDSTITVVLRDYEATEQIVEAARSDETKNAVIDYLSIEKGMYQSIFGTKERDATFNSETVNRMNMLLVDVGDKVGALSMPPVTATTLQYGTLKTRKEMIERMEVICEAAYGYDLKKLFLQSLIGDAALLRLEQNTVNIVLVNVPTAFANIATSFAGNGVILSNDVRTEEATPAKPVRAARSRKPAAPKAEIVAAVEEVVDEPQN